MRKYVARAMAVAAFASALSFSGAAFAANSLITPVDPGVKPAVADDCYHEKSYTRSSRHSFFGGDNERGNNQRRGGRGGRGH